MLGFGYIPYNTTVTLKKRSDAYDEFGIPKDMIQVTHRAYIRENDDLKTITDIDGNVFTISYEITVEGKGDAVAGDYLVLDNGDREIKSRKFIRDFGGTIIATKYWV